MTITSGVDMHCEYRKADGQQCRNRTLRGKPFCFHHTPFRRLGRWSKSAKVLTAFGIVLGVIGIVITLVLFYISRPALELAFRKATEEVIEYFDTCEWCSPVFWPTPRKSYKVKTVLKGGEREGRDEFFLFDSGERRLATLLIIRDRTEADMEPAVVEISDEMDDVEYKKIIDGYESAVVAWGVRGSGGVLTLRVLMWTGDYYVDLLGRGRHSPDDQSGADQWAEVFEGSGGFTFADLDGDGWKELIITYSCKSLWRRPRYFKLSKGARIPLYEEITPDHRLYTNFYKRMFEVNKERQHEASIDFIEEDCNGPSPANGTTGQSLPPLL